MAFYNEIDDEDIIVEGGVPTPAPGSSTIGTSGSEASTGNAAQVQAPARPGTFAGIQDYVNANKTQTTKLAGDVGGMVMGYGNDARSSLNTGVNQFNQEVDKNTINLDDKVFNSAKTNATQVANNQPDLKTFQGMRDAEYKGPANLQSSEFYQPINESFNTANTASNNTQTDRGQRTLLGQLQQKQRGKVNQGSLDFNSALLQGDADARQILNTFRDSNADLSGLLSGAKESASNKAAQGGATTANTKKTVNDAFTGKKGVQGAMEKELELNAAKAINQSTEQSKQTMEALKNNTPLNPQQLASLGLTSEQYNTLKTNINAYNTNSNKNQFQDWASYATQNNPEFQINAQNIASQDDYAKYAALNQLMGTNNSFLSNRKNAGTANLNSLSFNQDLLNQDLQQSIDASSAEGKQAEAERAAAQRRAQTDAEVKKKEKEMQAYMINPTLSVPVVYARAIGKSIGYKGKWCFALDTIVELTEGSIAITDLKIGDEIFLGGKVLEFEIKDTDPTIVKLYNGVHLTEDHKVLENKKMVAVKDSSKSRPASKIINKVVYIVTEKHVVIANDTIFSDCFQHGEE